MSKTKSSQYSEKHLNRIAWVFSGLVFILVLAMRRYKVETSIDFGFLPAIYSLLNTITFFLLLAGFYAIRFQRNMMKHQRIMSVAVLMSALFLLLYVTYHFTTPETKYCGVGMIRGIYFTVLISHIVLAAVILPFILFTYIRAYTNQYLRHRRMARWVWPLWLYVTLTGPIIFLMLKACQA